MANRDIVVIGASAGGVEALLKLVGGLPKDLPAAIFVVLHLQPRARSYLPAILGRASPLPARHAEDGETIERGRIYIARPDHHLVIEPGHVHLGLGPKEQHQRPSINVAFRTAAAAYGERVIGVVLTGELDDGTAGLWDIRRRGGIAVVQHPEEAPFPSMPLSALREVEVNYTVPVAEIGPLIARLVTEETKKGDQEERRSAAMERRLVDLTCPDCRGNLWESSRGGITEFRCRVGHAFSAKRMLVEHFAAQEKAMWAAIVALEEGVSLSSRLAEILEPGFREKLLEEGRQCEKEAAAMREFLETRQVFDVE